MSICHMHVLTVAGSQLFRSIFWPYFPKHIYLYECAVHFDVCLAATIFFESWITTTLTLQKDVNSCKKFEKPKTDIRKRYFSVKQ